MNLLQRFATWLLAVSAVPVGLDNDGVNRPFGKAGTDIDKTWFELYGEFRDALEAWRKNPMARRIIGLITAHVVGPGIKLSSEYGPLQRFLSLWWSHEENLLDMRIDDWCDELSRSGELFVVLFTAADGVSYVRTVPACLIEELDYDSDDYEKVIRYKESTAPGDSEKWWMGRHHPDIDKRDEAGRFPPVMLHFAVNRPLGALRGESDLAPILVWLKRYNRWLEDRVRLNAGVRAFLWVVRAPRSLLTDLRERYRTAPEPGTVIVADSQEEWQAVSPNLNARDASADGRAVRWMVAAGGPGTALTDFGEGEDANLATARATGELRRRFLLRRQGYFGYVLAGVALSAYHRWLLCGGKGKTCTLADVTIAAPDITSEDNAELARSVVDLASAMLNLRQIVGDSLALRRVALRLFVKFSGETITEKEFDEVLEGQPVSNEVGEEGG